MSDNEPAEQHAGISWRRYGPNALLFELDTAELGDPQSAWTRVERARGAVAAAAPSAEVTAGFSTVLCDWARQECAHGAQPDQRAEWARTAEELLAAIRAAPALQEVGTRYHIPVKYGGPDLERVAVHCRMSTRLVITLHSAPDYLVRAVGFMPGFPYLQGLDPRLATPRLALPRTRIAAGSVGIGGNQTGIYPIDSPGGWNLIGHTEVSLFDPIEAKGSEASGLTLRPGDTIRFVPE